MGLSRVDVLREVGSVKSEETGRSVFIEIGRVILPSKPRLLTRLR